MAIVFIASNENGKGKVENGRVNAFIVTSTVIITS
jgi:hypothetical protein